MDTVEENTGNYIAALTILSVVFSVVVDGIA